MSVESPFKFLDSYSKEDSEIFFGREVEIEEVYNKVFHNKTLFVYGESGTGKSSLINCGLANKFKDTDWLPVSVRRGENINISVINELEKLAQTEVTNLNGSFSKNLLKYTRSVYLDYFKPIYFIFDQFEELYLMGSKEEWKEFVAGIKALSDRDLQVHFIFIIRAEYLHFMSEFEEELPQIFNNKLRVEKITRLKAKECVEGPCKVFDIKLDEKFTDLLFDQLSPDRNEIELTYLQVFLDRVYKLALEEKEGSNKLIFSKELLDDIGMVSDVLSDFLDDQIESMEDKETTLSILKAFVTVDGTKRQVSLEDVLSFSKSIGKTVEEVQANKAITGLLERRILKELPDQEKYELRHDALALKIFEKITMRERELIEVRQFLEYGVTEFQKRGFLLNEHDLLYVEPHLRTLDLSWQAQKFIRESQNAIGKKRRTRNRVIGIIAVIVLLLISSVYGFFDARNQRQAALVQKGLAEESAIEAESQKQAAQENEKIALDQQKLAVTSSREATRQAVLAERNRQESEKNRIEAEKQRIQAIQQSQIAISARQQAELNAEEAQKQRNLAEEERLNAERLRMLALAQSLGAKSIQARDSLVKSFMAAQAFQFNNQFGGYPLLNEIYNGLYQTVGYIYGENYNDIAGQQFDIRGLFPYKGTVLSLGSDGRAIVHNYVDNQWKPTFEMELNMLIGSEDQAPIAVSTAMLQNEILVVGTEDGQLIYLNIEQKEIITQSSKNPEGDGIWKIVADQQSSLIYTLSTLGHIHKWDLSVTGNENLVGEMIHSGTDPITSLVIDNEGSVVFNEGRFINSLSINEGTEVVVSTLFELPSGLSITTISLDPKFKFMALGMKDGSIQVYDYRERNLIASLPGHSTRLSAIAFNPEGTLMVSGSYDRSVKLWDVSDLARIPVEINAFDSWIMAITFTDDGKQLLIGDADGRMKFFDMNPKTYFSQLCAFADRNMTTEEWARIVGDEFNYSETCPVSSNQKQ